MAAPLSGFIARFRQRNFRAMLRFLGILLAMILGYSLIFELLMAYEGQEHSVVSAVYWTLTTMSTLGYGDIVFRSDAGRLYSIVVLLSGIIFLLVLLPFTFIKLFYEPWVEAREASHIPRAVRSDMQGHVILTFFDSIVGALIPKLKQFSCPYVIVLPELDEVTRLRDTGIEVIWGELNDPETYKRARVEHAALVATTRTDIVNTSVVFTVRGITPRTPIVATARTAATHEILRLAGCSRVVDLSTLMAEALARRAIGGNRITHVIGQIDDLVIAEVGAARTPLVGNLLRDAQLHSKMRIVGFWGRGNFEIGQPDSTIEANTVLVIVGSSAQLNEFEEMCRALNPIVESAPVIIIGGGRVGRATTDTLTRRGIDYRVVEQLPERISDPDKYVLGSAADKAVLQKAGIERAPTVIITTHDDETNVYLTILCRLLRPDIQIISRSTLELNVAALHRAGSDIVMSYASMGANVFFNLLQRSDLLMIAEGLNVFKVVVPEELAGKTLAEANFRQATSCSVIGIDSNNKTTTDLGPESVLTAGAEMVLIGTPVGETAFLELFPTKPESTE